jgi:hypothetical protein
MLFRLLLVCMVMLIACRGDYRKAQWHYNAVVVQYNTIVEVTERLEMGFGDTASYRAVNEKMDSLEMLLKRLKSTVDTLSLPDEDERVKQSVQHWSTIMQDEILPLYQSKIDLWKMMHVQQSSQDDMRIKQMTAEIEQKKIALNDELMPVLEDFVSDYKLSYRPQ